MNKLIFENNKIRRCQLCNSVNLEEIYKLKDFPLKMAAIPLDYNEKDYVASDMTFLVCGDCKQIYIEERIPKEILYSENNNTESVGEIWKNHFKELAWFYFNNRKGDDFSILEIGDPSRKLARHIDNNITDYHTVEPNPQNAGQNNNNFVYFKQFFDKSFNPNRLYGTIIHSHVLEHQENPKEFLDRCFELLKPDGRMIFSVPNMSAILKDSNNPVGIMNFEHPYYVSKNSLDYLLCNSGFLIEETKEYLNHSLFINCSKRKYSKVCYAQYNSDYKLFLKNIDASRKYIVSLKDKLKKLPPNTKIYLFSGHVKSQYILNQIYDPRICGILDNSTDKIGKKLYGTDLKIENPNIIGNYNAITVIVNHMGIYASEIAAQLRNINKDVIIL